MRAFDESPPYRIIMKFMKSLWDTWGSPFAAAWLEIIIAQQLSMKIFYGILMNSEKRFMGYMGKSIRSSMARNYNCSTTFIENILWDFNEL
jgi:hypothetical protein